MGTPTRVASTLRLVTFSLSSMLSGPNGNHNSKNITNVDTSAPSRSQLHARTSSTTGTSVLHQSVAVDLFTVRLLQSHQQQEIEDLIEASSIVLTCIIINQ